MSKKKDKKNKNGGSPMNLNTVKVPEAFVPLFIQAQAYVSTYFGKKDERPDKGTIEIFDERYILVRAAAMSVEFFEAIIEFYKDAGEEAAVAMARSLLYDMAHAIGRMDARNFNKKMGLTDPVARLSAGPVHFAYAGWAFVDIFPESQPSPDENYCLIYDHPFSFESDAWLKSGKKPDFPVCVMNAGYSSGWCEESFGIPLVASEIMCKARGDEACRFIMAPPSHIESRIKAYTRGHAGARAVTKDYTIPGFFSRKSVEEKLRQSEERFKELFNNMSSGVAIYEAVDGGNDFVFRDMNAAGERIDAIRKDDLVGRRLTEKYAGAESMGLLEVMRRVYRSGKPENLPAVLYRDDRMSGWRKNYVYRLPSGEIVAVYDDVSAAMKAEEALRASESKYRILFENANEGILIAQEGRIVFANRQALAWVGYPADEVGRHLFTDFIHPDDRAMVADRYMRRMRGEAVPERYDFRVSGRDGAFRWVTISAVKIEWDGKPATLNFLVDITDRKAAEDQYRTLFENANDLIQSVCADGRFLYVNPRWCQVLGYTEAEAHTMTMDRIVKPDQLEHCRTMLVRTAAGEAVSDIRTVFITKNGREVPVEGSVRGSVRDGRVEASVGIFRDMTERRRMDQEILRTQKLESIGSLAGGIAHDFNNILMGIMGNVNLAQLETNGNAELEGFLDGIVRSARRAEELTKQLLTFSKGGDPVRRHATLTRFLKQTTGLPLSGSRVKCSYDFAPDLWSVEIDKGQMGQVISNIVQNAIDAMPEGGRITVKADNIRLDGSEGLPVAPGRYIRIAVTDEGHGIPEDARQKVFDPFFSTRRNRPGLGLAVASSVVMQHEGHILAEAAEGGGTRIVIFLPAADEGARHTTGYTAVRAPGRGRILVMDDEEVVRMVTGRMLQELGYEVTVVEDGQRAIEAYVKAREEDRPFDAVIMDLTIPGGMGGAEAAAELNRIDPAVRAIVSSGYSSGPVIANFRDYGFMASVPKPYEMSELRDAVAKVLGRKGL